ncbi:MAG: restriction endonuclease subunit S [Acidobacteriota bacterium]
MLVHAISSALGNHAGVRAGYPFRGSIEERAGGTVRAVQMKDIDPVTGGRWEGVIRTELSGRGQADWLAAGDILFVSRGTRFHAACIGTPPGLAVCGSHLFHLRVKAGRDLLPAFLAWQINQPPFQRQLQRAAEGSSQLSVRRPVLEALSIAVPPLADQACIVELVRLAQRERQLHAQLVHQREREIESIAEALDAAAARPQQPPAIHHA